MNPAKIGLYPCRICDVNLTSQITLETHLAGKNHKKKVKSWEVLRDKGELDDWSCELLENARVVEQIVDYGVEYLDPCSPFFCQYCITELPNEEEWYKHLETEEHKAYEAEWEGEDLEVLPDLGDDQMYKCRVCDKQMWQGEIWNNHVAGKQHTHKLKLASMKYRSCGLCGIEFTNPDQMSAHFVSRRHMDAVVLNQGVDPYSDWHDGNTAPFEYYSASGKRSRPAFEQGEASDEASAESSKKSKNCWRDFFCSELGNRGRCMEWFHC